MTVDYPHIPKSFDTITPISADIERFGVCVACNEKLPRLMMLLGCSWGLASGRSSLSFLAGVGERFVGEFGHSCESTVGMVGKA
jgi:hypothetical protein